MSSHQKPNFLYILPVLFLEYLSISLIKTMLPNLLLDYFKDNSYYAIGISETVKGLLAFISCPLFGKLSDKIGRKICILISMLGTTLPIIFLYFSYNMMIYIIILSLSGIFSVTFSLTFAYISDCINKKERASAYGLALATFGLSFSIGPVLGGYLKSYYNQNFVFFVSFFLIILNIFYIIFYLPETIDKKLINSSKINKNDIINLNFLNIKNNFKIFINNSFMLNLSLIVFLYYTSVWAIVSTLMIYVTKHLHISTINLGWLLSFYGISTIISEAILVRIIVPRIGEENSIRIGLIAFTLQCLTIAFGNTIEWVFVSVIFSMFSNLFYPSVSSLVSKIVDESEQGEALGSLNGIKALTEGFGPLFFGILLSMFENTNFPGAPYILAGLITLWAFLHSFDLLKNADEYYAKENSETMEEGKRLLSSH